MCMLCVIPPNVLPDRDKLINSALNNPHGFGFAIAVPSEQRIICERTMNADESINNFFKVREKYMEGYAIWHARYATHGATNVNNCHPFIVGNDKRTYLAHNGVLDIDIPKNDDRSDTKVFAEELLPAIGGVKALDNDWVFDMLSNYTSGSKVAVLTVDPEAEHPLYLLNGNLGSEDKDGVWWSNNTCNLSSIKTYSSKFYNNDYWDNYGSKDYVSKYPDLVSNTSDPDDPMLFCPNSQCRALLDNFALHDGMCYFCSWCLDCDESYEECMCYTANKATALSYKKVYNDFDNNWERVEF
jgi:Glutamine amidotransferase domain